MMMMEKNLEEEEEEEELRRRRRRRRRRGSGVLRIRAHLHWENPIHIYTQRDKRQRQRQRQRDREILRRFFSLFHSSICADFPPWLLHLQVRPIGVLFCLPFPSWIFWPLSSISPWLLLLCFSLCVFVCVFVCALCRTHMLMLPLFETERKRLTCHQNLPFFCFLTFVSKLLPSMVSYMIGSLAWSSLAPFSLAFCFCFLFFDLCAVGFVFQQQYSMVNFLQNQAFVFFPLPFARCEGKGWSASFGFIKWRIKKDRSYWSGRAEVPESIRFLSLIVSS